MQVKSKLIVIAIAIINGTNVYSQTSINSGASSVSNEASSVTSAIGQVFFQNIENETGKITEGIQQPYEILVITGIEENRISLVIDVYPNPTTDFLILNLSDPEYSNADFNLHYKLMDDTGRVINTEMLIEEKTKIDMSELNPSLFMLQVFEKNKIVKTFKIIKN